MERAPHLARHADSAFIEAKRHSLGLEREVEKDILILGSTRVCPGCGMDFSLQSSPVVPVRSAQTSQLYALALLYPST